MERILIHLQYSIATQLGLVIAVCLSYSWIMRISAGIQVYYQIISFNYTKNATPSCPSNNALNTASGSCRPVVSAISILILI